MEQLVTIKDWGRDEYLDGALMQYCVVIGKYPYGDTVAYCATLEIALALAHGLGETVVIDGPS